MAVTTEPEVRRHQAASRPGEWSASSKRRAHRRARRIDTARYPGGIADAARPGAEADAAPDSGMKPRYAWQAISATYEHLRPAS
jgi:hypothetical protein